MRISIGTAFFFCLFWTCASSGAFGRDDTTHVFLQLRLHLQSRFSFIQGNALALRGLSLGYVWGPSEREITLGYHWLGQRGVRQWGNIQRQQALKTLLPIYPRTEAGYANLGYWHIFYNSRRWKTGIPLEIGFGHARTEYYSVALDRPLLLAVPETSRIVPVQVGGYVEWKATRWVGFGVQSGYRYNLLQNVALNNLNGMYYRFRVIVYPAAYRDGFNFVFRRKPLPSPFFKKKE